MPTPSFSSITNFLGSISSFLDTSSHKPRIGISMRVQPSRNDIFGQEYVVRQAESDSVKNSGGSPYFLQHKRSLIPLYIMILDGLVLSGNTYDIADHTQLTKDAKKRLTFEMELATAMIKAGKPVMTMCGGMQMLVKIMGGNLIHDIPSEINTPINHNPNESYRDPAHSITILDPQSAIGKATKGKQETHVNSIHHQGIMANQLPSPLVCTATAPDGIVEALELRDKSGNPIAFGTQFHPELRHDTGTVNPATLKITETDEVSKSLYDIFMERVKAGPVAYEQVASIIERIKQLDILNKVKASPYRPDYAKGGVMPSASPVKTEQDKTPVLPTPTVLNYEKRFVPLIEAENQNKLKEVGSVQVAAL